jgi:hypothetical protein
MGLSAAELVMQSYRMHCLTETARPHPQTPPTVGSTPNFVKNPFKFIYLVSSESY